MLSTGFFAQAMMNDSFISIASGAYIDPKDSKIGIDSTAVTLSFGDSVISSMEDYYGFYVVGAGAFIFSESKARAYLSLKYGYEFMRDKDISLGLDASLLVPFLNISWSSGVDIDLVKYGSGISGIMPGVSASTFALFKPTDNLGFLLRLGADTGFPTVNIFAEVGLRWYL